MVCIVSRLFNNMDSQRSSSSPRPVPKNLKSLEVEIVNRLQKDRLIYYREYFNTGGWYEQNITSIPPKTNVNFTVSSREYRMTGVSGGMTMRIGETGKFLVLGFTNPLVGCKKTWVDVSHVEKPKVGYRQAKDGDDKYIKRDGYTLKATIETSSVADKKMVFVISDLDNTKSVQNEIVDDRWPKPILKNTQSVQNEIVHEISKNTQSVQTEISKNTQIDTQPIDQPDNQNGPDQPNPRSWSKIIAGAAAVVVSCLMPFSPQFRRVFVSELLGIVVRFLNATKEE